MPYKYDFSPYSYQKQKHWDLIRLIYYEKIYFNNFFSSDIYQLGTLTSPLPFHFSSNLHGLKRETIITCELLHQSKQSTNYDDSKICNFGLTAKKIDPTFLAGHQNGDALPI